MGVTVDSDDPFCQECQDKFWSYVDKTGSCWIWIGTITGPPNSRYGHFYPIKDVTIRAHRYSYMIVNGLTSIPGNLQVNHIPSCSNKLCVNPAHLYLGTQKDNVQDMYAVGHSPGRKKDPNLVPWRIRRREYYNSTTREWNRKNRERRRLAMIKYRQDNAESIRVKARQKYKENKQYYLDIQRRQREKKKQKKESNKSVD